MPDIDIDAPGTTLCLMGNEAIARGALEGGVGFAAAYPGTPSSEILPTIAGVAKRRGIYAEWSVNEIVAIEGAASASLSGVRAMVSMKQNGTQVACDFLGHVAVHGVNSGLIIVSCDDPGPLSSGDEPDTRLVGKWLDIPVLEPGNFQEAKDMTKWLLDLSEELHTICMLRSVTRISHSRGNVKLGELPKKEQKAYFDFNKFGTQPVWRGNVSEHALLHQKLNKAREKFESSPFNWYVGPDKADLLIITSSACWLYSQESVKALKLEDRVGILKLGTVWPLPEKFVERCLGKAEKVLVVEEIDPFIEQNVMELVANLPSNGPHPVFYGKRSGHINAYGEQNPDLVVKAVTSIMGLAYQAVDNEYVKKAEEISKKYLLARTPTFCPGCPHRATYWAIKNALRMEDRNGFVTGDIGCYGGISLGPAGFSVTKTFYCMGAGVGLATGMGNLGRFGFNQPVFAVCGDSTFFHASIPGLINAVYNKSNLILVIMDNSTTAMTGHQPHPGTGMTAMGEPTQVVSIEALCRSVGARVEICDPFDLKNTTATLQKMLDDKTGGVRVLITRRECELQRARKEKTPYKMHIDTERCLGNACGCNSLCTRVFCCPGLILNRETGKTSIDEVICAGCGVCADICPQGAIIRGAA